MNNAPLPTRSILLLVLFPNNQSITFVSEVTHTSAFSLVLALGSFADYPAVNL